MGAGCLPSAQCHRHFVVVVEVTPRPIPMQGRRRILQKIHRAAPTQPTRATTPTSSPTHHLGHFSKSEHKSCKQFCEQLTGINQVVVMSSLVAGTNAVVPPRLGSSGDVPPHIHDERCGSSVTSCPSGTSVLALTIEAASLGESRVGTGRHCGDDRRSAGQSRVAARGPVGGSGRRNGQLRRASGSQPAPGGQADHSQAGLWARRG